MCSNMSRTEPSLAHSDNGFQQRGAISSTTTLLLDFHKKSPGARSTKRQSSALISDHGRRSSPQVIRPNPRPSWVQYSKSNPKCPPKHLQQCPCKSSTTETPCYSKTQYWCYANRVLDIRKQSRLLAYHSVITRLQSDLRFPTRPADLMALMSPEEVRKDADSSDLDTHVDVSASGSRHDASHYISANSILLILCPQ